MRSKMTRALHSLCIVRLPDPRYSPEMYYSLSGQTFLGSVGNAKECFALILNVQFWNFEKLRIRVLTP